MPRSWKFFRLGEVCIKIGSGATPRGGDEVYLERGPFALIRSQNVYNDGFHRDGLAFIGEKHAAELENVEVLKGDVLLNITGDSVARACQVDPEILPARVNQHVAIIRPNPEKLDSRFLRYFLVSPEMQIKLLSWAGSGGTRNALTKGMIESFEVLAPIDTTEQRAIGHILGTLDDKIELNRRMNETLEAMARAIFKSWFVDATENGVRKGWRWGKVEELVSLNRETINPSEFSNETLDHYSIPAYDESQLPKAETGEQIQSNKCIVPPSAVLLSKLNPRIPRIWLPNISQNRRSVCSTEFLVAVPRAGVPREFLYGLFSSQSFMEVFATLVTGTSGSHQRVKPESLVSMDIAIPPKELIVRFAGTVRPMYERITHNLDRSRTLAAIRNVLLPKLLSGQIRVEHRTTALI